MPEIKNTHKVTGEKPGLVQLTVDNKVIKQIYISDAKEIDLELTVTEHIE